MTGSLVHADAAPPSKTLERAIKLYDRKDFYSASIELEKVITHQSGDDVANEQRAQFFLGKTLYQMGYYAAASATFDGIAQDPKHAYFTATMKWLVALARVLPVDDVPGFRAYKLDVADAAELAQVRDEIELRLGELALARGDLATATTAFGKIDATSMDYPQARLGLGLAAVRRGDDKAALAAFTSVPSTVADTATGPASDASDLALLGIAAIDRRAKKWDDVVLTAGRATRLAAAGQWEVAVAKAEKRGSLGGLAPYAHADVVSPDGIEPALLATVAACTDRSDGLASGRKDATAAAADLDKLLAAADDNADLQQHAAALRAGTEAALSPRARAIAAAMLKTPSIDHAAAFVAELDTELSHLSTADKAWQTTQIASEILQELTVVRSVSAVDLGKLVRDRLTRASAGLRAIAAERTKLQTCD
jgi:hypothetical protein